MKIFQLSVPLDARSLDHSFFIVTKSSCILPYKTWCKARRRTLEWLENCAQPKSLLLTTSLKRTYFEIQCKRKPRVMFHIFSVIGILFLTIFFLISAPVDSALISENATRYISFSANSNGEGDDVKKEAIIAHLKSWKLQVTNSIWPPEVALVNEKRSINEWIPSNLNEEKTTTKH